MKTTWAVLLCCLLAGCAASSEPVHSEPSVLVVRAYIESARLHRKHCHMPDELIGVVDCFPGPRDSVVTFVVEKTLVGKAPAQRLRVEFVYSDFWPELELGRSHQYLVALTIDGSLPELEDLAPVARTAHGGWAIPVTLAEDRYLIPCSMDDAEPESVTFRRPRPRESLAKAGYDEEMISELEEDGTHTIEGGYAYATKGVLLEHALAAYAGKSASEMTGECH